MAATKALRALAASLALSAASLAAVPASAQY